MIVQMPKTLSGPVVASRDGALGRLNAYWNTKRGPVLAPRSDTLFLSDLAPVIPHVLMCFRDDEGFRIEFAGAEVQDLLGFDPTGEVLRADDPEVILVALSRAVAVAERCKRPEWPGGPGWSAVALPFVEVDASVSVILAGLVAAVPSRSAEVLSFTPR